MALWTQDLETIHPYISSQLSIEQVFEYTLLALQ